MAKSIQALGLNFFCAYQSKSAKTNRPSASVFITSIVSPFRDFITSPGRVAFPDGMFSTNPTIPITFAFAFLSAKAFITPATTPAPPISIVISSIPPAGFIEIPPVSKTTPLPTNANGSPPELPPSQCIMTTFDSLSEPCPTHKSVRIPIFSKSFSFKTSTRNPIDSRDCKRLENSCVVKTLAGSLIRSLVKLTPRDIASFSSNAFSVAETSKTYRDVV